MSRALPVASYRILKCKNLRGLHRFRTGFHKAVNCNANRIGCHFRLTGLRNYLSEPHSDSVVALLLHWHILCQTLNRLRRDCHITALCLDLKGMQVYGSHYKLLCVV